MASETGYLKSLKTESIVQRVINCSPAIKFLRNRNWLQPLVLHGPPSGKQPRFWHTWAFWKANVPKVPLSQPVSGKA